MSVTSRAARFRFGCLVAAGTFALAGCASSASSGEPDWKPKPSFSGEGYSPPDQQPVQPGNPGSTPPPSGSPSSPSKKAGDPAVVATKLSAPVGIAIMPDGTALVGERTTGRIVRVQPKPGQPVQMVRTLTGLSTSGDGGLLDLAISPNYAEDNLLFAYITTPTDNRVVTFTLSGPVTPVLTGIPRGKTDNVGKIVFAADGSLLIGTGDAGKPALAANPRSLAGKILRVTDVGAPAAGNPRKNSRIYASGLQQVNGLCTSGATTLVVESRPSEVADSVYQLRAGAAYGWPRSTTTSTAPVKALPETSRSPGGCAVSQNVAYATSLDGKALLDMSVKSGTGGSVILGTSNVTLRNKYGRLRTVVAAPDGALWLTTSNRDGSGKPITDDERVLRIVPSGGGGGESKV